MTKKDEEVMEMEVEKEPIIRQQTDAESLEKPCWRRECWTG